MDELVANARMYAVDPTVEAAWERVLAAAGERAGVRLRYERHPAPAPLDALWARPDLGLAFVCGRPFATGHARLQPVAAPVPAGAGGPVYRTDLVVRADTAFGTLADTFDGRIGWTVGHSQSGFVAVRRHLEGLPPRPDGRPFFRAWIGPLVTPRAVVDGLLGGAIEVGPIDSYWHALFARAEPETASRIRVVARTAETPIPLLAASPGIDGGIVERLRGALVDMPAGPDLDILGLSGFAPVSRSDYAVLAES